MNIQSTVEAHDSIDAVPAHHGKMDRIARREGLVAKQDVLGRLSVLEVDREDVIDNAEQRVEGRLNGIAFSMVLDSPPFPSGAGWG
jgi:hypothetical protein